jgi:hypothetical protein
MSREVNGPELPSRSRMSRRNESVVANPDAGSLVAGPVGRAGEVEAQVAHRPHERVVLEQRAVLLEGLSEVLRPVRRPETAPGDQIRAGRDGRDRVDLQQGQLLHDREQIGRPRRVEQLRAHRDASGLRLGEPVDGHDSNPALRTACRAIVDSEW